ncbi:MAG: helix-turn-helix domain-containing protein [Bacteroidales bacterium]|nr:helix-turn-helix domain-containing protein [Bacteroidales bacterium]
MYIMQTIGELIREKRAEKGLLLRQLAALLEIDQALLSKIERGERKATRHHIIKLAAIFEMNKNELLVQFFSDKIAYELADEDIAKEILKVAEKKVAYIKMNNK